MKAEELINQIFSTGFVIDEDGEKYGLHSSVTEKEGEFISKIITENKYHKSIEIGCAYGISSLFICAALPKKNPLHTIIDPFQQEQWKNIGITNLKRCNLTFYRFIKELSEIALPELLKNNEEFDFAFIDGWHTFDQALLDFFYINRMLKIGGTVVFDDTDLPSINRVVRYVTNYPNYVFIGNIGRNITIKRKIFNIVKTPLTLISKAIPEHKNLKHEIFSHTIIDSDRKLKLQSSMIAFKKIAEDKRAWDWYKPF